MKKTAKLCVAVAALSALTSVATYAATPGGYAGLGLGASAQETPTKYNLPATFNQRHTNVGFGGRLFGGYNFNKYVGIEAGFNQYAKSTNTMNARGAVTVTKNSKLYSLYNFHGSVDYKMSALDVVGKGYLPFGNSGFDLYALAGVALVHSTAEVSAKSTGASNFNFSKSQTQNKLRPIVGIGASYAIPQTQLTTNLEFSHIQGTGNLKTDDKAIPSADMLTLGLAYNFG